MPTSLLRASAARSSPGRRRRADRLPATSSATATARRRPPSRGHAVEVARIDPRPAAGQQRHERRLSPGAPPSAGASGRTAHARWRRRRARARAPPLHSGPPPPRSAAPSIRAARRAFTTAPDSSCARTASTSPEEAARCRGGGSDRAASSNRLGSTSATVGRHHSSVRSALAGSPLGIPQPGAGRALTPSAWPRRPRVASRVPELRLRARHAARGRADGAAGERERVRR